MTLKSKKAVLVLADGSVFEGTSLGAERDTEGEVVFTTSMTGYQSSLTDPSYHGQILVFTYPLIGNYGTADSFQGDRIWAKAAVVREDCENPSHRLGGKETLDAFLKKYDTPGIMGVDTRSLVRKIRQYGVLNGVLKTQGYEKKQIPELRKKAKKVPDISNVDLIEDVTCRKTTVLEPEGKTKHHVGLLDLGVKLAIVRNLLGRGAKVTRFPYNATPKQIHDSGVSGLVISNGPGDPQRAKNAIKTVRELMDKIPILGICFGNQIIGLAAGAKTYKLKFGHRGSNQPVKDLEKDWTVITSQNHGYVVGEKSLEGTGFEVTHLNLNDGSVEGIRHKKLPVFSVQYHPEANPGPWDTNYFFDDFLKML